MKSGQQNARRVTRIQAIPYRNSSGRNEEIVHFCGDAIPRGSLDSPEARGVLDGVVWISWRGEFVGEVVRDVESEMFARS